MENTIHSTDYLMNVPGALSSSQWMYY